MSELLERVYKLKHKSEFTEFAEDVKSSIEKIEKLDLTEVETSLQNSLLSLFNSQNNISEKRKEELLEKLETQAKKYSQNQQKLMSEIGAVVNRIQASIESIDIPKTDLSSVENLIKNIKPTDISKLSGQIQALASVVEKLTKEKPPKMSVDLNPVLDAINKPKVVTFKVETDQWGFPKKVIAQESNK